MIGNCGNNCSACPAYYNNAITDVDKENCSTGMKEFLGVVIEPKDAYCYGCKDQDPWKDDNVLPKKDCLVRKCVNNSGFKTCANCADYRCNHVDTLYQARFTREWVEERIDRPITEDEYETFVQPFENWKKMEQLIGYVPIMDRNPVYAGQVKMREGNKPLQLFLKDLRTASTATTYIEKEKINKSQVAALAFLYLMGRDGRMIEDDLIVEFPNVMVKKPYSTILRQRDEQSQQILMDVIEVLNEFDLTVSIEDFTIKATGRREILNELNTTVKHLEAEFGLSDCTGWDFEGKAYKRFKKANF